MASRNSDCSARSLRRQSLVAASCLLLLAACDARAGSCGDDVAGRRVACACGDMVVADTVLSPTDPVVTETCGDDGLTLVAPAGADSITLNLAGQSITGRGHGTGIRVAQGGRLGAVILGGEEGDPRAEIARFRTGIRASGRLSVREIRAVDVHHNLGDGLVLHASGATIADVRTEANGRDGLVLSGHGSSATGIGAHGNGRDGLQLRGSGSTVDARTTGNGRDGASVAGRGHRAESLRTANNAGAGVTVLGRDHELGGVVGSANGEAAGAAGAGARR